ncbi:MAG: type II toxin-antitoxin system HicA family toxin [Magnetococcales bacterium]|nr:type II toxin-antitoxin system HicA family toxin [Magnetococcales bacterium]
MPRIAPLDWQTLARIFEADGFIFHRQHGSHRAYIKPGVARPVMIPTYPSVGSDIIHSNMRTARMSRERFLELLAMVRGH